MYKPANMWEKYKVKPEKHENKTFLHSPNFFNATKKHNFTFSLHILFNVLVVFGGENGNLVTIILLSEANVQKFVHTLVLVVCVVVL